MVGLPGFERRTKRLGANSWQLSLPTRDISLLMVVLLLLFGGGGFYFGGPVIGGGGIGLILVICLVIYFVGGFRSTKS
jgi:hypothetical protein